MIREWLVRPGGPKLTRKDGNDSTSVVSISPSSSEGRGGTDADSEQKAGSSNSDSAKIADLEARIERLLAAGREIMAQRDLARKELTKANQSIAALEAALRTAAPSNDEMDRQKFRAAKNAFARLYHPDHSQATGIERIIRQEIFKEFWKHIEQIENQ